MAVLHMLCEKEEGSETWLFPGLEELDLSNARDASLPAMRKIVKSRWAQYKGDQPEEQAGWVKVKWPMRGGRTNTEYWQPAKVRTVKR